MVLGSLAFAASTAEAKTVTENVTGSIELNNAAAAPQWQQNRRNNRINRRGVRIVNRTRIVRRGYAVYRETWQYRYLPNGRVTTRLVSRVRVR